MENRIYAAIDLKSFYASVECVERGLDPLTTNLVVADPTRTEKTICLAVSPPMKANGIPGRPRLFEVIQKVADVNVKRQLSAPNRILTGSSCDITELNSSPSLAFDYITAPPQMSHYLRCSARIYNIYLKYIAPEDIHVYSVDEVFLDITAYLRLYNLTPRQLIMKIILDVLRETGITATAGIGTNLYLSKVAMDIGAKKIPADENGVRIAVLDEMKYRKLLWSHRPLTDFWRVGRGYAKKLEEHGIFTMGDIARCSVGKPAEYRNEALLYKLFGINAELLIDHAWGWEPCTINDIRAYTPSTKSISSGQVLPEPYTFEKAKLIVREMTDLLVLDLVEKELVTDQLVLNVGYDIDNLRGSGRKYRGAVTADHYGRFIPKHAHGSANLGRHHSSTKQIQEAAAALFERITDKNLLVRRLTIAANNVLPESSLMNAGFFEQLSLFSDYSANPADFALLEREKSIQKAILKIKRKYGKNAILKGMNLESGGTTIARNSQIGGHKA